jgi:hypothetical protein
MKIGALYRVKHLFWLLFPSKETAIAINDSRSPRAMWTSSFAAVHVDSLYYSYELNCIITHLSPNDLIVLIEEDDKRYKKFLTTDGRIGWVWFDEDYNDWFEEMI